MASVLKKLTSQGKEGYLMKGRRSKLAGSLCRVERGASMQTSWFHLGTTMMTAMSLAGGWQLLVDEVASAWV